MGEVRADVERRELPLLLHHDALFVGELLMELGVRQRLLVRAALGGAIGRPRVVPLLGDRRLLGGGGRFALVDDPVVLDDEVGGGPDTKEDVPRTRRAICQRGSREKPGS